MLRNPSTKYRPFTPIDLADRIGFFRRQEDFEKYAQALRQAGLRD